MIACYIGQMMLTQRYLCIVILLDENQRRRAIEIIQQSKVRRKQEAKKEACKNYAILFLKTKIENIVHVF